MADFFFEFTEAWLVGVGDIVSQVANFFFFSDTNYVIGNVILGILVFNLFFIYIIRPATHASSDTILTKGISHYTKGVSDDAKAVDIDGDKALGEWYLNKHENTES